MRWLLILFLLIYVHCAYAQSVVENYVKQNAVAVKTISPDSINYDDLEPIGNAIGDAKIVMLGEQDHGDAPTFLAKTRLIKYLHEKKGFNVLAFESDFFGLNKGWDELNKNEDSIRSFLKENIFGVWTDCNACSNLLYKYIPDTYKTGNPLLVTGFDNQIFLHYSVKNLMPDFDSVLKKLNLSIIRKSTYASEIFPLLDTLMHIHNQTTDTALFNQRNNYLVEIKNELKEKLDPDNFWLIVADNLIAENQEFKYLKIDYRSTENVRDAQMALNLKWLSKNKFSNNKIIVWAANYHIAKYADSSEKNKKNYLETMGSFFTKDSVMLNKTYIIGFSSREGTAGRLGTKPYEIPKLRTESFEGWINDNYNYAFIDFKQLKDKSEPFFMQGFGHMNYKRTWATTFDGVFYIKEMYPCTKNF